MSEEPRGKEYSVEEYSRALRSIRLTRMPSESVLQMFQNHYSAPGRKMTPPQLAESVGYKSYSAVNLHYGDFGRRICEELGYIPPPRKDGEPTWTCGIAWGSRPSPDSEWEWTMYENLATAAAELGMVR